MAKTKSYPRSGIVNQAKAWVGLSETTGTYSKIIDTYNTIKPLPRGIKMQKGWAWCACTWSAIAIAAGYTEIIPIEMSCGNLVELAKKMKIWQENDAYVPKPGDGVLYDWQDTGVGDNTGWPDHIGVVIEVYPEAGYFVTIEGNWGKKVSKRTISINGKQIRGFITPKYTDEEVVPPLQASKTIDELAHEVISGKWGSGAARKTALEKLGYNYAAIQKRVNEILNNPSESSATSKSVIASCKATSTDKKYSGKFTVKQDLYCRNDAGTNKKALCAIPAKTKVSCDGSYTKFNGADWLLIDFTLNGTHYIGFSHSAYLEKSK